MNQSDGSICIWASKSLVPRHSGHLLGFDSLSSENVKPHCLHFAGSMIT